MYKYIYDLHEPLGLMAITASDEAVTGIAFHKGSSGEEELRENALTRLAADQLREYIEGRRKSFDLPIAPEGTPFRKAVWSALQAIPYGETRTYGKIAAAIGNPGASRAVGMANNKNPIVVVIPCHRVIGLDGGLVGFGGGLDMKRALLDLESRYSNITLPNRDGM